MKMSVLKVPFGPEVILYEGEFYAVTRHRIMLFFYFGLVCMILVASTGSDRQAAKPELVLGLAAIEVSLGLAVILLFRLYATWQARRTGSIPRIDLGLVLVATVFTAVGTAEILEPLVFGTPGSSLLDFLLKLVFYITVTELMTSIMMQYTLGYILEDLRRNKTFAPDGTLLSSPPEPLA